MWANVERRAQESQTRRRQQVSDAPEPAAWLVGVPEPTALTQAPSAQATARIAEQTVLVETRPPVVLTKRERRVKDILLKELAKMNRGEFGTSGLSYAQRKHLEQGLSIEYLDRELASIERQHKLMRTVVAPLTAALSFGILVLSWLSWDGWSWSMLVQAVALCSLLVTIPLQYRAARRKRFIYEALRELTDADEVDVLLDRATLDADALIQKIVERELSTEARYPLSLPG
ncbi:MAG: hypothetical protein RhofKO_35730 [Rhodothermales bacterium]